MLTAARRPLGPCPAPGNVPYSSQPMPVRPQLLIFDLDGTLIDSRHDLTTAVNHVRAHYGLPPLSMETVTAYIGNGVARLVARALEGTGINPQEAVALQAAFYRDHLADATVLYPGVAEGLPRLQRAGHVLAVATNKPVEACDLILRHFRIREHFSHVLGGGSTPHLKPDPEPILTIRRLAGLPAVDTWVIGDHYTDLEAARRAGVRSIFALWGFGQQGAEQPTRTASSFAELTRLFAAQTVRRRSRP